MAGNTFTVSVTSHAGAVNSEVDAAIKRALEICGGKAETYAKNICPVDTGNLRDHITHKMEGTDTEIVASPTEYAPYVEFGHHTSTGRFVSPRHFLIPSLENHIGEYRQVFENELKKI